MMNQSNFKAKECCTGHYQSPRFARPDEVQDDKLQDNIADTMEEDVVHNSADIFQIDFPDMNPQSPSEPNILEPETQYNEQTQPISPELSKLEPFNPKRYLREKGKDDMAANHWDMSRCRHPTIVQEQPHPMGKPMRQSNLDNGHTNSGDENFPVYSDGNSSGLLKDLMENSCSDHDLGNGLEPPHDCQVPMTKESISVANEGLLLDRKMWDRAKIIKMKPMGGEIVFVVDFGEGTRDISHKVLAQRENTHWKIVEYLIAKTQIRRNSRARG